MNNFKRMILAICLVVGILAIAIIIGITQQPPVITKTDEVTLTINPSPDFNLAFLPDHLDSFPDRVVTYTASVTSVNNFAGEVVFSVEGLPPEITVSILPSDTLTLGAGETKGVQIDVGIPLNQALVGDYTITVTATSTNYN